MAKDVEPRLKEFIVCPCGCGLEGNPKTRAFKDQTKHVRGCKCRQCKGRNIRSSGNAAQKSSAIRAGTKKVGTLWAGHEEQYTGAIRQEVKSGAQVKPLVTAFDKAKTQSEASRPVGDTRPFIYHAKPLPTGKRQITAFESNTDEEYLQAVYALAEQLGIV